MNIFNDDVKKEVADFLLKVFDDPEAVKFCMELLYVFHLWDDLYDQDKERSKDDINQGFVILLDRLRRNSFFRVHQNDLYPLIMSSVLQWHDANIFEDEGEYENLRKSYMLRANIYQIWAYCAFLLKGYDFYKGLRGAFSRLYDEDYEMYLEEFYHA